MGGGREQYDGLQLAALVIPAARIGARGNLSPRPVAIVGSSEQKGIPRGRFSLLPFVHSAGGPRSASCYSPVPPRNKSLEWLPP